MPTSIDEFWKLAIAARLFDAATCKQLQAEFAADYDGAVAADATALSRWLVQSKTLSRYQASVLLSGRPGPFVFGDFVIIARIESGRLARLFRAVYKRKQPVLLVFAPSGGTGESPDAAIMEQFDVARAIQSPHVARVYQYESTSPPFFVIEDLRGASLRALLDQSKPSLEDAYRIAWHAALGLSAMHDKDAMHGALCSANVWIHGPTAKLLQFPLSVPARGAKRLRGAAVDYLAPELADASCAADRTSDIYALGCVTYEAFAGHVPFAGGSDEERLARHLSETPPRLDRVASGVDTAVAELVSAMLAKSPGSRVRNARDVADALESIVPSVCQSPSAAPVSGDEESTDAECSAASEAETSPSPLPNVASSRPRSPAKKRPDPSTPAAKPLATAIPIPPAPESTAADEAVRSIVVSDPLDDRAAGISSSVRSRRRLSAPVIGVGAGLVLVVVVALAAWLTMGGANDPQQPRSTAGGGTTNENVSVARPTPGASADADEPSAAPSAAPANHVTAIDDDGSTLWISPTEGQPLDVRYIPSSAQVILALRPAELLALEEGAKVIDALGPAGAALVARAEQTLGVSVSDVEQVTVAFVPDATGVPQAVYVVRLVAALPLETLLAAWGNPQSTTHKTHTIYQRQDRAYYLPPDESGRVALVGPTPLIKELLEHGGDPLLRRGIRQLLRTSDAARHVNLVLTPSYLLTDGKSLLAGDLARLHEPLEHCFDMRVQAVLASAHLGDELFLELRAVGPSDVRPEQLAQQLHERLVQQGERLEHYVAALSPQPYGRLVVHRFPRMVQLATSFTRFAGQDRQAVLRCYLPGCAAHNLVMGAELTLFENPGMSSVDSAGPPPPSSPPTAALDRMVSLSFPRDTLERTMEMLSSEMGIPITILGSDLQLEGITKNQSFGLDERDQRAREVLLKVLKLANPDGKLVYLLKPDESGNETLFITTRAAVARRGERLPPEFAEESSGKVP